MDDGWMARRCILAVLVLAVIFVEMMAVLSSGICCFGLNGPETTIKMNMMMMEGS